MSFPDLPFGNPFAVFGSLTSAAASAPPSADIPVRVLWSKDPFHCSQLLSAIAGEAINRGRKVCAVYDPLLPERLTELSVEGLGHFTLFPTALSNGAELIDCTIPTASANAAAILAQVATFSQRRSSLESELRSAGRAAADNARLLAAVTRRLADTPALSLRGRRITRRFSRSRCSVEPISVATCGDTGATILHLPFSSDTKVIHLQSLYGIESLFLSELADNPEQRGCTCIPLTHALTRETVGVWLPEGRLCYLIDFPCVEGDCMSSDRRLNLRRYLLPHTVEERRAWRNLAAAVKALHGHIDHQLAEYRAIAKEEETLRSSLYSESRLQNFRKRLLIDLFCS